MKIQQIQQDRRNFLPLLSLADDPKFIEDYLEKGDLFAGYDIANPAQIIAVALVTGQTKQDEQVLELQNLAVSENFQKQGYGAQMLTFLCQFYAGQAQFLLVRTDEYTAKFYENCGFSAFKRIKNYFPKRYGRPVFDKGRQIKDNIYLRKAIK